jgi:hypothetical protein
VPALFRTGSKPNVGLRAGQNPTPLFLLDRPDLFQGLAPCFKVPLSTHQKDPDTSDV